MSGIALLKRLLMKQAMKKSAGSSGIMTLNKGLAKDVETQVAKWVDSAKSQGQDIDKMGEQELKYLIELNKPKGPTILGHPVIDATSSEGKAITESLFGKKGEVVDLTGKKIPHGSQIMGGKEVKIDIVADTIATIKSKKPIDAMAEANSVIGRKGKYKNLTPEESKKILKDTNDHIFERDIPIDPEDLAGGGRTGYDNGKFVSDPTKKTPKNFYNLGIGPDLGKFMSEGVPRDEKGFHTTLNKEDLKYMWEVLQGKHPIKDIEDELMFRFGRVNPEKKSEFFAEIGKDKGGIGWKKKFAGGGRTSTGLNYLLGEDDQNSRVPYAGGGMGRRLFLKLMGGAAAGTAAAKSGLFSLLKGGGKKQIVKDLTSIPIKSGVDGMPVWFKPLVNKVIKDGTDVTKELGTIDRQLVHKTKLPNSKTDVYVTQDLNTGDVLVDIGSGKHGFKKGHLGQPVRLEYRASEVIEPTKTSKGTKTKEEFWVDEAEFTGGHPENIKFEETSFEKFGSHGSDFSEVEKFATGKIKKKTTKESLKAERAHWTPEGDYASGGRVPLGKGKLVTEGLPAAIAYLRKKFGQDIIKKGSQLGKPQKTLDREMFQNFNKKLKKADKDRPATADELEDAAEILDPSGETGSMDVWDKGNTIGRNPTKKELDKMLADHEAYLQDMMGMYKRGELEKYVKPEVLEESRALYQKKIDNVLETAYDDVAGGSGFTGDYKYDADVLAESMAEQLGKVYDDLPVMHRSQLYDSALKRIQKDLKMKMDIKRLSKPTQTLEGIKKTGTINISDEGIADEFTRFMKESDPKGFKDLEQKVELSNLDIKGKKGHATGGRVSLSAGGLAGMLGE